MDPIKKNDAVPTKKSAAILTEKSVTNPTERSATVNKRPRRKHEEGDKFPQYVYTVLASFGALIIGTSLGWSSPSLKYIENLNSTAFAHVHDDSESSLIAAWIPIGAIFGGIPAGLFADYFGRKNTLINFTVPWIISWFMLCFSPFIILVHMARFISGVICGLFCGILPMYVAEISEDSIRGVLGMFFQTFLSIGVLLIYSFGIFDSYHVICSMGACITIIYLMMLFRIPESPIWLCQQNRYEEAEQSLKLLRGSKYNVKFEIFRIKKELRSSSEETLTSPKTFTKPNIKGVLISVSLMVIQQFTGINVMIFFGESILIISQVPNASVFISFISLVSAVATFFSIFLIDRLGRRILLLISTIGMAISSAIFAYCVLRPTAFKRDFTDKAWLPIISFTIYIVVYALGLGPIPWFMTAELLMPEIKKFGTGIVVATTWIGAAIITYFYKPISNLYGAWSMFITFTCIATISSIYIYFVLPETKGKSIEEIREVLGDESLIDDEDDS